MWKRKATHMITIVHASQLWYVCKLCRIPPVISPQKIGNFLHEQNKNALLVISPLYISGTIAATRSTVPVSRVTWWILFIRESYMLSMGIHDPQSYNFISGYSVVM